VRKILGPEVGARLKPIWGLDTEGEIRGAWRDVGVPRVWYMMGKLFLSRERNDNRLKPQCWAGNFALCRFHSKHIALREFIRGFFFTRAPCSPRVMLTMAVWRCLFFPEIKAMEEGIFDEKRYSLESPSE
jgi:hypothetical protein